MKAKGSILAGAIFCLLFAMPAFGQCDDTQIEADCDNIAVGSFAKSASEGESGDWDYVQLDPYCDIQHIFAVSGTDIYAGGYKTDGTYSGCLYHSDGTDWRQVNVADLGPVFDIWGSASDDIYVVGLGFGAGRYHFDGTSWTKISSATGRSIWGFSRNDVFIGAKDITRFQGAAWQTMLLPAGVNFSFIEGIWGTSSEDLYAVGNEGTSIFYYDGNPAGQWEHFDNQGLEEGSYAFDGIWGSSAYDIFVIGYRNGKHLILHYDGSLWTTFITSLADTDMFMSIWGSGPDDVYAVSYHGYILHYDGISWSIINPPAKSASSPAVAGANQLSATAALPDQIYLNSVCGASSVSVYFAGDDGIVIKYSPDTAQCQIDSDCDAGYQCVEGECIPIPDDPPVLGEGPWVVAGPWPILSASSESPTYMSQNYSVLWTFSDDFAACQDDCTHAAEYQVLGDADWTPVAVSSDAEYGYAWVDLPIENLQNATSYAFRFAVTDCAGQTTESNTYYFRVATSDAPPVIGDGPLLTDSWQVMPVSSSRATLLDQDTGVLWTFSDDYASCAALCTHRARYRRVGDTAWTSIPVETDPAGDWYAYTTLPVGSLAEGVYQFRFDVRDCAGQSTYSKYYYFKIE